jgi:hypothetical protein
MHEKMKRAVGFSSDGIKRNANATGTKINNQFMEGFKYFISSAI